MGFAQELKDFTAGLQSGWKMMEDSEYKRALAKYYKSKGGGAKHYGYGSDDDSPSALGRLFGASDPNEGLSDFERGSKSLVGARSRAFAAGDVGAVEKLDRDIIKYNAMKPADVDTDDDEEEVEENAMGGLAGSAIRQAVDAAPMDEEPQEEFNVSSTMSQLAMPGVDAGLRDLNERLKPEGAVMADPREQDAKFAAFANNEGAATKEEIAAINGLIDPEGKLPPEALSSARIAAVYEFYDKKGDPDQGAAMANRLLLADKANSQTRGALAMEAIQNGDLKAGAKLIADAYNVDLPGDMQIQPAVADDGSITAKIIKGGVTQEEINATPAQLAAMAKEVASGKAYTDQLARLAAEAKARAGAEKAKGKSGGSSRKTESGEAVDTTDLQKQLNNLKRQHASAESAEEKAAIEDKALTVYNQLSAKVAPTLKKGKSLRYALEGMGITPLVPGAGSTAKPKEPTTDDRTSAVDVRAMRDAEAGVNADTREALPVASNGMRSEGGAVARAAREAVDSLSTGNLGARKADIRAEGTADREFKQTENFDPLADVGETVKGSQMLTRRAMGRDISVLESAGISMAQKNNLTKAQVKNLLEDIADPRVSMRFDSKGRVQIGDNKPVVLDGATARQLQAVKSKMDARVVNAPADKIKEAEVALKANGNKPEIRQEIIDRFIRAGYNPPRF